MFRALVLPLLVPAVIAQDPPVPPAAAAAVPPQAEAPHHLVRVWPRDRDVAVAVVGSRTLTLADLVTHIEQRHWPGFSKALEIAPEIQRILTSDLVAPWVRHFADIEALRQLVGEDTIDQAKLEAAQSAALKRSFESWMATWVKDRQNGGRQVDLTQDQVTTQLTRFQQHNGLAAELQGFLDFLEPGEFNREQLRNFYNDNARAFGGQVTIAHILVQHRDAGTGILLTDEGIGRANQRLAAIKASLSPDGSNFEEVARARSEDLRTAPNGGKLQGLHRYDDRMPGALCRAAWALKDGEVSDVVETQYGFHLIKRLDFNQQVYILFTDDAMPTIKQAMQRARQEERLFAARAKAGVRLML
ncbi:MAG: peptidylprolyl isomerase [Planctomycetota bacterium]